MSELNTIEIDTDTVEVYAFPPPLEAGTREVADGKQRKPETLTGLWGWIAHRLEVPPWGQALIVVLIATFLAIGSTLWSGFGKLTDINIRLTVIDTRLGLQAGINLIGEVKEYAARGDNALAIQTVENMKSLVAVAKEKKVPPPPGYFARMLTLLDDVKSTEPAVASKLFGARIALTEYHSALEPPPDIPKNLMKIQLEPGTIIPPISVDNRAVYRITDSLQLRRGIHVSSDGAVINALDIPSGTTIFIVPTLPSELPDPTITGLIMLGGSQVLDGAKWKNVVFFNTHIVYRDGNATLDGIRFVNCTFDLPENERGTQLANYAALEKHFLAL